MKPLFVDTAYWVALFNPRDQWHQPAQEIDQQRASARLITTEAVLVEFLNYFSSFSPDIRRAVAGITHDLLGDLRLDVIVHTHELFLSGLALYEARLDKGYSMVDCMSMQVMQERGLMEVLTHDDHFKQEGFTILLGV